MKKELCVGLLFFISACVSGVEPLPAEGAEGLSPEDAAAGVYELRPDLTIGGVAEDALGEISAVVPAPGDGIFAEAMFEDGHFAMIQVETRPDGLVIVRESPEPTPTPYAGGPSACSDGSFNLQGFHWASAYRWKFNAGTTPGNLSVSATETSLKKAATNITTSRDNCGLADQVSATQAYDGRTTRSTNITTNGTCNNGDGASVVGFGDLPAGVLALTCTYFSGGIAVESDVRINKADFAWYNTKPTSCSNKFSIEAVMTHEQGHTFGLGHVAESTHGNLTMSTQIGPCDDSAATLGLGDVKALRQLY